MTTDWIRIINSLFEGTVQGIVGVLIVLITYKLGKLQSDREWKREIADRESDRGRQEHLIRLQRQIDSLKEVIRNFPFVEIVIKDGSKFMKKNEDTLRELLKSSYIATAYFEDNEVRECLNTLYEITGIFINDGNQQSFFDEFIEIKAFLIEKLGNLETDLVSTKAHIHYTQI